MQDSEPEAEDSVKFIRLNTGEDLIAEILEVKDDEKSYYVFVNPLKVVYTMSTTNSGILSVGLMQWVLNRICEEQQFNIYPEDVLTMATPTDDLIEYYFGCVDHFMINKKQLDDQTEFEDEALDDDDTESLYGEYGMDDSTEMMKDKKRKLH